MSFATRLCVFVLVAGAGVIAWHWNTTTDPAHDVTQLALRQFHNDAGVPERLQQASLAQNWWPIVWPGLLVMLGAVLFWDDVEHWWKKSDTV